MRNPLVRGLLKLGAVLVGFALLAFGARLAVFWWADDTLVGSLRALPGVVEVTDEGDAVQLRTADDLAPDDARLTVDNVMAIAKNQPFFRARPVHVHQGAITTTMTASAPTVPPGRYRGDAGAVLGGRDGIATGELGDRGGVTVVLRDGVPPLPWLLDAAAALEQAELEVTLTVRSGPERLALDVGEPEARESLAAIHQAVTTAGGSISTLAMEAGTATPAGRIITADRALAAAVIAALRAPLGDQFADARVTTEVTGDVAVRGLDDPAAAFALADHVRADGLQAVTLQTDLSQLDLVAATPEAIDLLVAKTTEPGWTLPPEALVRALRPGSDELAFAGRGEAVVRHANFYQSLWRGGFADVSVGSSNPTRGYSVRFSMGHEGGHDYTDTATQRAVTAALRGLVWPRNAEVVVDADPDATPLSFRSSAAGPAQNPRLPLRTGLFGGEAPWGETFIEAWDETAAA